MSIKRWSRKDGYIEIETMHKRGETIEDYDLSIAPISDGDHMLYDDAIAAISKERKAMAAALDFIARRLQMDVDDGSRPDQWTMEDLIRIAKSALPDWWVIGSS